MTPSAYRPTLVLVGAYSTGALLARAAGADHRLVHARSRRDMPAAFGTDGDHPRSGA